MALRGIMCNRLCSTIQHLLTHCCCRRKLLQYDNASKSDEIGVLLLKYPHTTKYNALIKYKIDTKIYAFSNVYFQLCCSSFHSSVSCLFQISDQANYIFIVFIYKLLFSFDSIFNYVVLHFIHLYHRLHILHLQPLPNQ